MEWLLGWLLGNLGWESLKRLLTGSGAKDARALVQALDDAQNRARELERERKLMLVLVEQRNRAMSELLEARRRIIDLEQECARLRKPRPRPKWK